MLRARVRRPRSVPLHDDRWERVGAFYGATSRLPLRSREVPKRAVGRAGETAACLPTAPAENAAKVDCNTNGRVELDCAPLHHVAKALGVSEGVPPVSAPAVRY